MGNAKNVWKIERALEVAGITFIDEDEVDGEGQITRSSGVIE